MNFSQTDFALILLGTAVALFIAVLIGGATVLLSIQAGESLLTAMTKGGKAFTATLMMLIAVAVLASNVFGG
ncbi:hypothetical protein [Streptomyces sp. NPDC060198]|uniref:hypothetical protein n=1 Tax=Streptomyces sp. NPDC060198 TaxID=3347070 RepID=UPI0036651665